MPKHFTIIKRIGSYNE